MPLDHVSLDRLLVAGVLASLAVAIAFGPELGRALSRLRNRRVTEEVQTPSALGVESQRY